MLLVVWWFPPHFLLTFILNLYHSLSILLFVSGVFLCVEAQIQVATVFFWHLEVRNIFLVFYVILSIDFLIALFGNSLQCWVQGSQYASLTQSLLVVNVVSLHIPRTIRSMFYLTLYIIYVTFDIFHFQIYTSSQVTINHLYYIYFSHFILQFISMYIIKSTFKFYQSGVQPLLF